MKMRPRCSALLALFVVGCGGQPADSAGSGWVGTITTEGDVTTVVNESGSVWDAPATLVEEAAIGVESGDDNYMFARIAGIYATDGEIYVVDATPAVRVFDYQGTYLRSLGGEGQGPGGFVRPRWVRTLPDGRVVVASPANNRLNIYGPGPDDVESWPMGRQMCCLHPMVVTPAGVLWLETGIINEQARNYDPAFLAHGPDGPVEEPLPVPKYDYERWTLRYNDRDIEAIPNAPGIVYEMTPTGMLVAGSSDAYRFEVIVPDGPKMAVERYWDPVEVSATERAYYERLIPLRYSRTEGGNDAGFEWDGRLPSYKPAFRWFLPTHEGGIWVLREGPTSDIEGCDASEMIPPPIGRGPEEPRRCFSSSWIIDAFDAEGRYLGEVDAEGGVPIPAYSYIRGDTLVTQSQDEAGTIVIKRFRIVFPE